MTRVRVTRPACPTVRVLSVFSRGIDTYWDRRSTGRSLLADRRESHYAATVPAVRTIRRDVICRAVSQPGDSLNAGKQGEDDAD